LSVAFCSKVVVIVYPLLGTCSSKKSPCNSKTGPATSSTIIIILFTVLGLYDNTRIFRMIGRKITHKWWTSYIIYIVCRNYLSLSCHWKIFLEFWRFFSLHFKTAFNFKSVSVEHILDW
jgi:hypothetical protein